MTAQVKILNGVYGKNVINNQVFNLTKPYDAERGYVTVWGSKEQGLNVAAPRNCRVKCSPQDFEYINFEAASAPINPLEAQAIVPDVEQEYMANETDAEAIERIGRTFEILSEMADAAAEGVVTGLVVCGPPGIGKSYGVEKQMEMANMTRKLSNKPDMYEVVKGAASPLGLYRKLYMNSDKGQVLVFDDCDSILYDEECLNLLKAALDSGSKRTISWNKESRVLQQEDIPDRFDFEGSIVFLTNIDFDKSRGKIADHLKAIQSRVHYLDLEISSQRDQLLRIRQIVRAGMLNGHNLNEEEKEDVVDWVCGNADYLREISLRTVKKAADLAVAKRGKGCWKEYGEMTLLKRQAKFARLAAKKQAAA